MKNMTKGAAPHCTRPATPSGLHEPETAHEVPQQRPRAAGRTNRSSQSYQAALPGGARAPATAGAPPGARCRTRALQPRQRLPLGQRAPIRALAARHGLGHYLVAALQVVCRPEQVPPEALRDVLNAPAMRCQRRHASYCFSLKKKNIAAHTRPPATAIRATAARWVLAAQARAAPVECPIRQAGAARQACARLSAQLVQPSERSCVALTCTAWPPNSWPLLATVTAAALPP